MKTARTAGSTGLLPLPSVRRGLIRGERVSLQGKRSEVQSLAVRPSGLKIPCPQGRVSSNLTPGTRAKEVRSFSSPLFSSPSSSFAARGASRSSQRRQSSRSARRSSGCTSHGGDASERAPRPSSATWPSSSRRASRRARCGCRESSGLLGARTAPRPGSGSGSSDGAASSCTSSRPRSMITRFPSA
jgi:hypothetical protein